MSTMKQMKRSSQKWMRGHPLMFHQKFMGVRVELKAMQLSLRTLNLQRTGSLAVSATHMRRASPFHFQHLDVEELEMLLEAYFAQIDGTLNKLTTLREYVDDTEDYINIMLDDKQNHLLRMRVMLSTASLVLGAFLTLAGIFGMNITIDLFDADKYGDPRIPLDCRGVGPRALCSSTSLLLPGASTSVCSGDFFHLAGNWFSTLYLM